MEGVGAKPHVWTRHKKAQGKTERAKTLGRCNRDLESREINSRNYENVMSKN